jgi:anti-sigma factor RsiW
MSTELDDETLQRFYDGDLSPVEEHAVRSRIEQDPVAQKRLQDLERLSALIQMAAEEAGSGVDSAAMFANIEQQIAADGGRGQLRVVAGEWVSERKRVLVPLMAVAAAAAVGVLTLTARDAGDDAAARARQERDRLRYAQQAEVPTVHGTRVENVDFGSSTGTVFEIDSAGVATAVVWIADEEEEEP